MNHFVITGGAGFIGSNLIKTLFEKNSDIQVTCIDNFDPFYSKEIKERNIEAFKHRTGFRLLEKDISTTTASELQHLIPDNVDVIIHLAARAGVRPSIDRPLDYQQTNITGLQHLLDFANNKKIPKFIFASSSSVYGINENFPWKEEEPLMPISPYAMTKLSGEMLGHVYHKLYNLQFVALRFFTVFGPGQRPDLAIHKFTKNLLSGTPVPMYGDGSTSRDYTYIDDIIQGILQAIDYNATPFEIFNLGNHFTISLKQLIENLENITGKKAVIQQLPEQAGDLARTYADVSKAARVLGYSPQTNLTTGLTNFVNWFKNNSDILLK